jgi:hypothetical protein
VRRDGRLVLDICGVHVPAIEAFNRIMTGAIETEIRRC